MADEKKKPDLKARLNRTVSGQAPPAGSIPVPGAESGAPVVPPPAMGGAPVVPPPAGFGEAPGIMPPPVAAPLPGLGDVAPPPFVVEQNAQRAAAERAAAEARVAAEAHAAAQARIAAAAADPFSASSSGHGGQQEIRLVIDDKAVADSEVGRKNTGMIIGIAATAVVMLGAGYLVGGFMETRAQGAKTVAAMTEIQRTVNAAGTTIAMLKTKVDHAVQAAGIQSGEEGQQAQPAANAAVDPELIEWFAQQPQDPPFSPEVYAGRVGRLRPDLVSKLMKVQLEIAEAWRELRRHQVLTQPNVAAINDARRNGQQAADEFNRMMVIFNRGRQGEPPIMGTLVLSQVSGGNITITAPAPGVPTTRQIYQGGDLTTQFTQVGVPVSARQGTAPQVVRGIAQPWTDYVARLRRLQQLTDELAGSHRQLNQALQGGS